MARRSSTARYRHAYPYLETPIHRRQAQHPHRRQRRRPSPTNQQRHQHRSSASGRIKQRSRRGNASLYSGKRGRSVLSSLMGSGFPVSVAEPSAPVSTKPMSCVYLIVMEVPRTSRWRCPSKASARLQHQAVQRRQRSRRRQRSPHGLKRRCNPRWTTRAPPRRASSRLRPPQYPEGRPSHRKSLKAHPQQPIAPQALQKPYLPHRHSPALRSVGARVAHRPLLAGYGVASVRAACSSSREDSASGGYENAHETP